MRIALCLALLLTGSAAAISSAPAGCAQATLPQQANCVYSSGFNVTALGAGGPTACGASPDTFTVLYAAYSYTPSIFSPAHNVLLRFTVPLKPATGQPPLCKTETIYTDADQRLSFSGIAVDTSASGGNTIFVANHHAAHFAKSCPFCKLMGISATLSLSTPRLAVNPATAAAPWEFASCTSCLAISEISIHAGVERLGCDSAMH